MTLPFIYVITNQMRRPLVAVISVQFLVCFYLFTFIVLLYLENKCTLRWMKAKCSTACSPDSHSTTRLFYRSDTNHVQHRSRLTKNVVRAGPKVVQAQMLVLISDPNVAQGPQFKLKTTLAL